MTRSVSVALFRIVRPGIVVVANCAEFSVFSVTRISLKSCNKFVDSIVSFFDRKEPHNWGRENLSNKIISGILRRAMSFSQIKFVKARNL